MNFTDGFWKVKEGFTVSYPAQAYDVNCDDTGITVLAPCTYIENRGQTLGGPVLTIRYESPIEGIVKVSMVHFDGAEDEKLFQLNKSEGFKPTIIDGEETAELISGNLKVEIAKKGGFSVKFFQDGKRITESSWRNAAYIKERKSKALLRNLATVDDGFWNIPSTTQASYMREQLSTDVDECIYGLGERFTPFIKNGQAVECYNGDGGTSSIQSYKNIPFYISNKGYGVFVNHSENVSFEVNSENVSHVQFSVTGERLEYFVIAGPEMKDVLVKYTDLTGKPSLPPAWTFGLWLTTSFTTSYDEETVTSFVDGMAERKIPLEVFHFDCFWMREFNWCDFAWDTRQFPDPKGMLERLKSRGLKICVWINPYIAQHSSLFAEGKKNGYLIKNKDNTVFQCDEWQPGMAIVDFTNPEACKWFQDKLRALVAMGVDCFKTDFGERIPTDVVYSNGADPLKMHNYYTYLYNDTVFNVLKESFGEAKAAVFARSATVGSQKFPVHWGGDCSAKYTSMAESLRGGLSLCLSGFGYWSHDISGFEATATPDIYKRWSAFGLLSTHSRLHGNSSYRVPWLFDEESVDVLRHFTNLKGKLMPYLFRNAIETSKTGVPMVRPMILEFMEDPSCAYLDKQYMLGDSILVAPIFNERGEVNYYLPEGTWTNLLSGKEVEGGRYSKETHNYFNLPVMVKENSIIPMGAFEKSFEYDYVKGATLRLYKVSDAKCVIYDKLAGKALEVHAYNKDNELVVEFDREVQDVSILLVNVKGIESADAAFSETEEGTLVKLSGTAKAVIKLK
ncbi:alpha-xylosidase [Clostridium sp. 19966]|uniref:alpha-xylosidase n=1 Tax=Clostridium sp. 19966 TaxID=2768166 RepID=UPI0028DFEBDC|nr:alpha-xylosidase [Clostridium sp. 19966]MDT8718614.1 alpha-xylosidase [Clostridium sp. 19966]